MMSNIRSNKKLTGEKIGVYFGTFAPLHVGHQQQIYKCASLNDGVLLVVSGDDQDRGAQIGLPLEKRFRYLREAFRDEEAIQVAKLDENDLPAMPHGWDEWVSRLLNLINTYTTRDKLEITFYVGESAYATELKRRFPKDGNSYEVELADRQDIAMSATKIRENPQAQWDKINRVFRRHFSKVVTVMGSASTGKTTLVRRLARSINAPFSEDYLQAYKATYNLTDEELRQEDYARLITGQYDANSQQLNSPANQGIVFLDTDALVTRVHAKMNLPKTEFEELKLLFQKTIARERMDLILVIPPSVEKEEGCALQEGAQDPRLTFHQELLRQLAAFDLMDRVVILDDSGNQKDRAGYLSRYHHAIDAVKAYTGITIERLRS